MNYSKIKTAVVEFAKERIDSNTPEFHVDTLRQFVRQRTMIAPASPDRVLRALRQEGVIKYTVINRAKSLYNIYAVNETAQIQDETIISAYSSCSCGLQGCNGDGKPSDLIETPIDNKQKARVLIDNLVAFINEDTYESEAVWDILTALRGPDNGYIPLKNQTTARLRHAIGLMQSPKPGNLGWFRCRFRTDNGPLQEFAAEGPNTPYHFKSHYEKAYRAFQKLGII